MISIYYECTIMNKHLHVTFYESRDKYEEIKYIIHNEDKNKIIEDIYSIVYNLNYTQKIVNCKNFNKIKEDLLQCEKGTIYIKFKKHFSYKIFTDNTYYIFFEIKNIDDKNKKIIAYIKNQMTI